MEQEISRKFTEVRNILDKAYDKVPKKAKDKGQSGYTIGLVTSLEQDDIGWIYRELRRVSDHVIDVKYVNPTHMKGKDLDKALAECTYYIYIASEERWKRVTTHDQKKYTLANLGKKKPLIVLLTDMEDSSDQEKIRIIKNQSGMEKHVTALFLFGKMEKKSEPPGNSHDGASWRVPNTVPGEYLGPANAGNMGQYNPPPPYQPQSTQLPDSRGEYSGPKTLPAGNTDQYNPPPYHPPPYQPQHGRPPDSRGFQADLTREPAKRKHIVGIFSRSGERDFAWLVKLLRENFQDYVGDVRCCCISNDTHQQFQEDIAKCTFGIVYHTKDRGRINVTDVKDSLYDEELEELHAKLGQKNVLVLIDDLEDSSDYEKKRILHTQPSIERWACDLLLISVEEKTNNAEMVTKLKSLAYILGDERAEPASPTTKRASPAPTIPHAAPAPSKPTVAIFSRSDQSDYSWLSLQFPTENADVRHYKLPANNDLKEKAFKCKLVVLYHSRKHGKIHLTDLKEALYHEDLEALSAKYGKKRVVVVIDDLDEATDKVRDEILKKQPGVHKFSAELFLFSKEEKKHLSKKDQTKHERRAQEKISKIKDIMSQ